MNCSKCGASASCSCQLTNGMCAGCYSASLQANNPNIQNAPTQTK